MCLLAFAWQHWPGTPLLMTANRDEFYARPSSAMHWWQEVDSAAGLLAGKDLQAGGTWLGCNRQGQFAALTNYREVPLQVGKLSRGELVANYLSSGLSPQRYADSVQQNLAQYSGFNLLVGDYQRLFYISNRAETAVQELSPGIYGLSNALLDTPWPKTQLAKQQLQLAGPDADAESLFATLASDVQVNDEHLQKTTASADVEKALSPQFIKLPEYGTRVTSIIKMQQDGKIYCAERGFSNSSASETTKRFTFNCS